MYKFNPEILYLVYVCGNVYTVYPHQDDKGRWWFKLPMGDLKCTSASCVEFSEAMRVLQKGDAGEAITLTIL